MASIPLERGARAPRPLGTDMDSSPCPSGAAKGDTAEPPEGSLRQCNCVPVFLPWVPGTSLRDRKASRDGETEAQGR